MTPTKFPTEQILIASILATIAFLLIYMVYVSIKKSRAVQVMVGAGWSGANRRDY